MGGLKRRWEPNETICRRGGSGNHATGGRCLSGRRALSPAQLQAKTLSISNFPTGWSVDDLSSSGTSAISCLKGLQSSFKHEVKASVKYTDGNVPALQETIETGPGISARLTKFETALGSCKGISATDIGGSHDHRIGRSDVIPNGRRSVECLCLVVANSGNHGRCRCGRIPDWKGNW